MALSGLIVTDADSTMVAFGSPTVEVDGSGASSGYIDVTASPYNATGDGVTDDTAAILAAFTAANATNPMTVFFPPLTYMLGSQLTLTSMSDLEIIATGATFTENTRITGGGTIYLNGCSRIHWRGGKYVGNCTQAGLVTFLSTLGTPGTYPALSSSLVANATAVFKLQSCDEIEIEHVYATGKERFAELIVNSHISLHHNKMHGVLDGTLEPQNDDVTGVDDKNVILWTYAIQDYGTQGLSLEFNRCAHHAGLYVGGGASNYNSTVARRQPRSISVIGNKVFQFGDNGLYMDGCFDVEILGNNIWESETANYGIKMHGDNYKLIGNTIRDVGSGFQFAGKGNPASAGSADDQYAGSGGVGLLAFGNTFQNTRIQGFLAQSDGDSYPRNIKIFGNFFISCGMGQTSALGPHPFSAGNYGGETARPIRLMADNGQIEFDGNTIDESAGGAITSSANGSTIDADYTGKVAFLLPGIFHRLGKRAYIKVEGHSVAAYNGVHYILDVLETTGTGALLKWVITSTAFTTTGTAGVWQINHPPYAISTLAASTGSSDPYMRQLKITNNTFINCRRGVQLTKVVDGDFSDNIAMHLGGSTSSYAPALFCCEDVVKSKFNRNRMVPRGSRVLYVENGGVFSGNDTTGNDGAIDVSLASADFLPSNLSTCVAWWSAQYPYTMLQAMSADAWGDIVTAPADDAKIATWIDLISGARLHQVVDARRPLYKTNQINSLPALRFDGTDDFLRMVGEFSNALSGTVYVVFRNTLVSASSAVGYLLASQNEAGVALDMLFAAHHSASDTNRIRMAEHHSGTSSDITQASAGWADSTWKIARFNSTGSAYGMQVSDGAGAMTALTLGGSGNDGDWFGDAQTTALFRQSLTVGARANDYQHSSAPTWGGDAATFLQGEIAEIIVLDGDASASWAAIETYLFSLYGAI